MNHRRNEPVDRMLDPTDPCIGSITLPLGDGGPSLDGGAISRAVRDAIHKVLRIISRRLVIDGEDASVIKVELIAGEVVETVSVEYRTREGEIKKKTFSVADFLALNEAGVE